MAVLVKVLIFGLLVKFMNQGIVPKNTIIFL